MTRDPTATRDAILDAAQDLFMKQGYGGTSVNGILEHTGMTKGAFFHHFPTKRDLAFAIIERYAVWDMALVKDLLSRAESLTDDPVEQLTTLFKLYQDVMSGMEEPSMGCLFASFGYQTGLMDEETNALVVKALDDWKEVVRVKIEEAVNHTSPVVPVDANSLAEHALSIFEGGLILSRTSQDNLAMVRELQHYVTYLELLFGRV